MSAETGFHLHRFIEAFEEFTILPVLINSFEARREPIVCLSADDGRSFMQRRRTISGSAPALLLKKSDQGAAQESEAWRQSFRLDWSGSG